MRRHRCTLCGERFWTERGLYRHLDNFHIVARIHSSTPTDSRPSRSDDIGWLAASFVDAPSVSSTPSSHFSSDGFSGGFSGGGASGSWDSSCSSSDSYSSSSDSSCSSSD